MWFFGFEAAEGEDPAIYTPERCIDVVRAADLRRSGRLGRSTHDVDTPLRRIDRRVFTLGGLEAEEPHIAPLSIAERTLYIAVDNPKKAILPSGAIGFHICLEHNIDGVPE